jgi:hypothetical protein
MPVWSVPVLLQRSRLRKLVEPMIVLATPDVVMAKSVPAVAPVEPTIREPLITTKLPDAAVMLPSPMRVDVTVTEPLPVPEPLVLFTYKMPAVTVVAPL